MLQSVGFIPTSEKNVSKTVQESYVGMTSERIRRRKLPDESLVKQAPDRHLERAP